MAAYFQSSLNHNLPIILNLDNSVTLTPENFPIVLSEQMNFGKSDQQENNFSLDDLCKAATSDLLASNNKAENSRSCLSMALCSNDFQFQSKNIVTGIITNIGLTGNEDVSPISKHFNLKDKQNDKYKCEYCGKICAKPSILEKHIRSHTNERPYPCEECRVQFKTKSNLYKHCKSRSHLIQTSQTTDPKDAGDRTIEKLSPSTQTLVINDKLDIQENTSSSCDCQEDVATRPQGSVFFVNQLGQVILKPLSHIGISSSAFNSASAPSLSPRPFNMECVPDFTNTNCPRPLLKSLSEKGHSKAGHRVKPHSQSFSNEMESKHIPKLDRAMTYDDIQRRISLIISLNDTIIDTPKEIKNHRIRKIVRDHSYGGNISQNLCSGKLVTRSNSITPTLPNNDSFVSFCQTTQSVGSKSPSFQHSTFISAPASSDKQLWSLIPGKSSDSRPGLSIQNIQHFSLPNTGYHDVNEFKSFTKAHSFGNAQTILVSKSDSSLKTLNIASNQDLVKFFSEPTQEMITRNTLEKGQFQTWSQSLDANFTHSPAVSPSSSPILSTSQRLKRGRPKGSKNKLKLSPVSSLNSIQPIIPSIHITSVDESPPPESHWRKELKRHLLMKRSMSNENSADKDQTMPVTSTLQVSSSSSSSSFNSFSTSCSGIQHLSPSSIPIKKRRKTLTELGRGTAFGTTVDDHNLDLNASNRPKTMTKPLWSSDGSFSKTVLSDESDALDSKQIILNSNKEICQNASENIPNDLRESNSKMQIFVNNPAHNSCNSESLTKSTDNNAHVDMPTQPLDSNVTINLLKENHVFLPTHHSSQAAQALQNSGIVVTKCQSESSVGHLLNASSPHLKFVLSHQSCTSDKISDSNDISEKITDLIPVNPHGNQRLGIDQSVMHLKFKRFSQLEQTCDVRSKSSKSNEYNISNICGSNNASIESDVEAGINNSSNYNLDECLHRARLDSEAAASLLDLSKSRLSPSACDDLHTTKQYLSAMSDAKSNYSNGTFIPDVHVGSASSTDMIAVSPKNLHPPIASASPRDRHFFTNSISKSYNFIEGKHICNICQKVFPKEHGLILHKNVHYMEKPHRCGKCQATFQSNWLLKRHQNIAHHLSKSLFDPRPFKCVECKVAFRTRGHLAKHARSKLHSQKLTSKSQHDKQTLDSNDVVDEVADDHVAGEQFSGRSVVSFAPENNDQVLSHSPTRHHPDSFLVESSAHSLGNASQSHERGSTYNVVDHKADGEGIQEVEADSVSISEAKFKKISWMEKSRHYCSTKDIYHPCNQNFIDQESQPNEPDNGAKSCQSNNSDHQVPISTANRMTLIQDHRLFNCHVCSAAFEDIYLLLQHYKSHLEQRVHVCRICDAGFKSSENLDAHMSSHSEKLQHSLGIQTGEDRDRDRFPCESFAKNALLKVSTTSHDETLEILKDNIMPVAHLPTFGEGASNCCLTRESSIFSNLSQKCIMSSGQWSTYSSGFHHLPSPPLQHLTNYIMQCPGETELDAPDRIKKSNADGVVINNPPAHLLLQPITSNNISLIPKNTYFLVPSETNNCETSPNPGEILLYNPSAGCFIMAAGRSLSVDKSLSSLNIPVGSKPL